MKTGSVTERMIEVLGLMMIGEGVVGAVFPTRYSLFWKVGPRWLRSTVTALAERPKTTRLLCVAEIAAGLWIAARELRQG